MSYFIYLRKSRKDIELEQELGDTLARHRRQLLELAKKQNLAISAIYEEVVSGETIAQRPEIQRMLADIEQGSCDGVLVMEIERLARGDTVDQGIIARTFGITGTKIITPSKTYDPENEFDQEYFEFGLFMSRREYKTINRRIQAGRLSSVKEGKFVGNIPPYGYARQKIENGKGYMLVPDEAEAPVVQKIFDMYTKDLKGYSRIATQLNKHGITPRKARAWTGASVRDILHNPVYIGKIRWGFRAQDKKVSDGIITITRPKAEDCKLYDGLHEPLVSDETFRAAREISSRNRVPAVPLKKRITHPFPGLVICKKCGHHIVRKKYTSKSGHHYDMLLCNSTVCDCVSTSYAAFEAVILETLRDWLGKYSIELSGSHFPPVNEDYYKNNISSLRGELNVLNKQLEKCYTFLEQEIYSLETFTERSSVLKEQISEKESALKELTSEFDALNRNGEYQRIFISRLSFLLEHYHQIESAEEKNRLLKQLISKIEYEKNSRNKKGDHEKAAFTIDVYPYLPR